MDYEAPQRRFVLVVDDESILRLNAIDMFEDAGFEVLEAENADRALQLLEIHATETSLTAAASSSSPIGSPRSLVSSAKLYDKLSPHRHPAGFTVPRIDPI